MYHSSFLLFTHLLLSYLYQRAVTLPCILCLCAPLLLFIQAFYSQSWFKSSSFFTPFCPCSVFRLTAEPVKYPKRLSASSCYSQLTFPVLSFSAFTLAVFFLICFLLCIKQSKIKYSHNIGVMWQKTQVTLPSPMSNICSSFTVRC